MIFIGLLTSVCVSVGIWCKHLKCEWIEKSFDDFYCYAQMAELIRCLLIFVPLSLEEMERINFLEKRIQMNLRKLLDLQKPRGQTEKRPVFYNLRWAHRQQVVNAGITMTITKFSSSNLFFLQNSFWPQHWEGVWYCTKLELVIGESGNWILSRNVCLRSIDIACEPQIYAIVFLVFLWFVWSLALFINDHNWCLWTTHHPS